MNIVPVVPEATISAERLATLRCFPTSDAGNAEAFAFLHGDRFRYDHNRGKWLVWNGRYWEIDETGEADRAALDTVRQRAPAALTIIDKEDRKDAVDWMIRSESTYARRALLTSAQSIKELATVAAQYDRNPFLLTVGNGTIDLRTGTLRSANPDDLITRATDVPFQPGAECPRWLAFLEEVFEGDMQLVAFVQRAVGYTLTGDTREQCLFILYGGGGNGKSSLVEILLTLVGTHGAITSFSTFLVQQHPGSPRNDVAKLHGARLVKAAESHKQAALDEATVKEVTGGDTISARFLFREFFDFRPQFKIWLTTNHRPTILGTDTGIWRRIRLIPFNAQFTGKKKDPKLRAKLEAELPGILAWAVRGCLEWQRIGLGNAPAVELATSGYRRDSDHFGRFLAERCTDGPREQAAGKELFDAYVHWCSEKGERPESNASFAKALADRSKEKKRTKKGTVYTGVGLRPMIRLAKPPQINSP